MSQPFSQISTDFLNKLLQDANNQGLIACTDVLIVNQNKEIFIQKRSPTRKLYPNCWEVPGGHIENGESILQTLTREIKEEVSMDLIQILGFVDYFDWQNNDDHKYRNFQFLGKASGNPSLEKDKTTEFKWIKKGQESIMLENRQPGDDKHYKIIKKSFEMLKIL